MNEAGLNQPGVGAQQTAGPEATTVQTVGQRLRSARMAARLSVEDVMQALKFSPRQIEALEADDYAALPGATIVRGFVRNYARLLRLDADELLHRLEEDMPSTPIDVRPPDNMGIAATSRSLRALPPLVAAPLALLLAAVLLALWHFFGPATSHPARVAEPDQPAAARPAASAGLAEAAAPPADAMASEAGEPPVASVEAIAELHFACVERAWIEVTDARRQLLHRGESPAGSQLTLNGQPPFKIVIGNASQVTLSYGDRLIDLAPHTRANVARLTLE